MFLSSLASAFLVSKELLAENVISTHIPTSLSYKSHGYSDIIKVSNAIMADREGNKGEQHTRDKL